ncbi:MAG: DUF1499 domain-containing protein [Gemmatimonadota bacterium]|nr:MAG: DUF1499 domain-containing protein [Gemmatimonadota bacterium]
MGLWRALTQNSAQTQETAEDPNLRGRTYVVPFARVWDEIVSMVESRPRWRLLRADEASGLIHAEASSRVFRLVDDVRFKVKLDSNALTRVDMWSASRLGKGDLGTNARRIARFCRDLDQRLGVDG